MDADKFVILFGSKGKRPIDKGDVVIAKMALFTVKFAVGLVLAFVIFMFLFF